MSLLWVIPALPLAAFVSLAFAGRRMPATAVAWIGTALTGAAAAVGVVAVAQMSASGAPTSQTVWPWLDVAGLRAVIGLRLDGLTGVMVLVVTWIGFLILLYSTEYMRDESGYSRFFAYMNLFIASMLVMVLADNLLLLYLGWEGVGLCSYLLIGFWYRDRENLRAARKAFIVTRVGDAALAVGLYLLFARLGTLDIAQITARAPQVWPVGAGVALAAALLLLGGAVGKSAQVPLQVWLPDAMAGPTPVSALIHAATMVTAGVYLIARMHGIFELAPVAMGVTAVIGAITLLLSGLSAITQRDIKRVLAYSTISQLGYMFLALGIGAWTAAIFHLVTHAFFKALLFLGAGAVIHALDGEHDLMAMGGLRKRMPLTFWTMLAGVSSLAALPLVTAGFYSKDEILALAWFARGGAWLWAAGLIGALLTSLYAFRLLFLAFFRSGPKEISALPGARMGFPLIVLAVLSVIGGLIQTPDYLGGVPLFRNLVGTSLPAAMTGRLAPASEVLLGLIAALVTLGGVWLAWLAWGRRAHVPEEADVPLVGAAAQRAARAGFGFDRLYDLVLVRPYVWIARRNKSDFIDVFFEDIGALARLANRALASTQNGRLRSYAWGIGIGVVVYLALAVLS